MKVASSGDIADCHALAVRLEHRKQQSGDPDDRQGEDELQEDSQDDLAFVGRHLDEVVRIVQGQIYQRPTDDRGDGGHDEQSPDESGGRPLRGHDHVGGRRRGHQIFGRHIVRSLHPICGSGHQGSLGAGLAGTTDSGPRSRNISDHSHRRTPFT
jgi:hypothetical protein